MNEIQPALLSLDPAAARAFEALGDYFERLNEAGMDRSRNVEPHVAARIGPLTAASAEQAWNLGAMVLARAACDESAPEEQPLTRHARAMLDALNEEVQPLLDQFEIYARTIEGFPPFRLPLGRRKSRAQHLESAGSLLSEIAREERGVDLRVSTGADGQPVILVMPIDAAMSVVRAYFDVLDILREGGNNWKRTAAHDVVFWIERDASSWWFHTWSAPPRSERDEALLELREKEFSFFDRKMLSLDYQTVAAVAGQRLPRNALTRRQRALLDGAARSVCGFFVVREHRGLNVVVEDIDTSARYEIRAYDVEHGLDEGTLVAGRLIPVPEIGWFCSPGALLSGPEPVSDAKLSAAVEMLRIPGAAAYRSIVVEAVITNLRGEKPPPRAVRPAGSRKLAEKLLDEFCESALDAGLAHESATASAVLPEMTSEIGNPDRASSGKRIPLPADGVLASWIDALREQSGEASRAWRIDHAASQRRGGSALQAKRRRDG